MNLVLLILLWALTAPDKCSLFTDNQIIRSSMTLFKFVIEIGQSLLIFIIGCCSIFHNNNKQKPILTISMIPATGNQATAESPILLVVLEHKLIDKQMAYLILYGTKKYWMKLCDANAAETSAIIKYEQDKLNGVEPMYYPQADHDDQEREPQTRKDKQQTDPNCIDLNEEAAAVKYNLRVRELLLISKSEFYGLKTQEEKKQNIVSNSNSKSKREVKKEQSKPKQQQALKIAKMMEDEDNSEKDEEYTIKKSAKLTLKKRQRKPRVAILNVDSVSKRKLIKKQSSIKLERNTHKIQIKMNGYNSNYIATHQSQHNTTNLIEIYDGSDSQLKML